MDKEHECVIYMIKLGASEHIDAMLLKGEVYCNPIEYFTQKELDESRHDDWEGSSCILQPKLLSRFTIAGVDILSDLIGSIRIRNTDLDQQRVTHLFCMVYLSSLHIKTRDYIVDRKIETFGDSYCIVARPKEFLSRFKERVELMGGKHFRCEPINYVEDEFHGEYDPYKKRERYAWQQEIRVSFCMPSQSKTAVKIPLGSLEDICITSKTKTFKNKIEFDKAGKLVVDF